MNKNIIREIWEIRGLVDKAIYNQDMDLYNQAVERFREILDNEEYNKTFSTATINAGYDNLEALNWDRQNNIAMLTFDLYALKSQVESGIEEERDLQFSSVLEVIWYTRNMFDVFINNAKHKIKTMEENKIIFESMTYNLSGFYKYYDMFSDSISVVEQETIKELYEEVIDKHFSIYKDINMIMNLSEDHSIV